MNAALERGNIHTLLRNNPFGDQYWQQYINFRDLIIWYAQQLDMRATISSGVMVMGTRNRLVIHLDEWTMQRAGRHQCIKKTRSEFAYLLAHELARFDVARMLVRCILPQPIAEEIIPEMLACPVIKNEDAD